MATDGLITIPSSDNIKATLDRLESEVKARGVAVFARIDHAAGASVAGLASASAAATHAITAMLASIAQKAAAMP